MSSLLAKPTNLKDDVRLVIEHNPGVSLVDIEQALGLKRNRGLPLVNILLKEGTIERHEHEGTKRYFLIGAKPVRFVAPKPIEAPLNLEKLRKGIDEPKAAKEPESVPILQKAPPTTEKPNTPPATPANPALADQTLRAKVKRFVETSTRGADYDEVRIAHGLSGAMQLSALFRDGEITREGIRGKYRYFGKGHKVVVPTTTAAAAPMPVPKMPSSITAAGGILHADEEEVTLQFHDQPFQGMRGIEVRKVSHIGGKVILVDRDHVQKVKDGEWWLVRVMHRSNMGIATPLERKQGPTGQNAPITLADVVPKEVTKEIVRETKPSEPAKLSTSVDVFFELNGAKLRFEKQHDAVVELQRRLDDAKQIENEIRAEYEASLRRVEAVLAEHRKILSTEAKP